MVDQTYPAEKERSVIKFINHLSISCKNCVKHQAQAKLLDTTG